MLARGHQGSFKLQRPITGVLREKLDRKVEAEDSSDEEVDMLTDCDSGNRASELSESASNNNGSQTELT